MSRASDRAEMIAIVRELERREALLCCVVTSTEGTMLDALLMPTPLVARCHELILRIYPLHAWEDYVTGLWDGDPPVRCQVFATVQLARAFVDGLLEAGR
jgi:hypothetical protein